MKKALLLIIFIGGAIVSKAQRNEVVELPADSNAVYSVVETPPVPKGDFKEFYKYIAQRIHYPAEARKKNIQGKVLLQFIVERDGNITNVKVIRSASTDLEAEAVRVISDSPKWNPGRQGGKPVRVYYMVPIAFSLQTK